MQRKIQGASSDAPFLFGLRRGYVSQMPTINREILSKILLRIWWKTLLKNIPFAVFLGYDPFQMSA